LAGIASRGALTWGYDDDGAFKGVAIFRMRRIAPADAEAQRERLLEAFAVGLTLDQRATAQPPQREPRNP